MFEMRRSINEEAFDAIFRITRIKKENLNGYSIDGNNSVETIKEKENIDIESDLTKHERDRKLKSPFASLNPINIRQ